MAAEPFSRQTLLTHNLKPHYPALLRIRKRKELLKSQLWTEIGPEVTRILGAVEQASHNQAAIDPGCSTTRVVAWNIQRGRHFEKLVRVLKEDPILRAADVLLLSEVDNGLGRSGNRNVARELATALSMNYAFGVSYLTLEDDYGETVQGVENSLSLAGSAILSRLPLESVECVDLPELRDKFSASEKRLGKKRALLASLKLPPKRGGGLLFVGQCHLDSNASPKQRASQLAALLSKMPRDASGSERHRLLCGGDFNTTTYDASATLPLFYDLLHKLFTQGIAGTIDGYMIPEKTYEKPVFQTMEQFGFTNQGWNDVGRGTMNYYLNSPYAIQKAEAKIGRLLTAIVRHFLRPWNGMVPARLDWFMGRGLIPSNPRVVEPGRDAEAASDHAAIVVDVEPESLSI